MKEEFERVSDEFKEEIKEGLKEELKEGLRNELNGILQEIQVYLDGRIQNSTIEIGKMINQTVEQAVSTIIQEYRNGTFY